MRINTKDAAKNLQPASQRSSGLFTKTMKILLAAEVDGNNTIQIGSKIPPFAIWWFDDDEGMLIDCAPTPIEAQAGYEGEDNYFGYSYTPSEDSFKATSAYYIPSEDLLLSRMIDDLDINLPLSKSVDKNLEMLNLKLENATRNLSIWDTFNIHTVAYNREELSAGLGGLPLNSSIVVNTDEPRLQVGSWEVQKGDMIIKDAWGSLHHLKGANGGVYFPSSLRPFREEGDESTESNGVFQIAFSYSQTTPKEGEKTISNDRNSLLTQPYNTIKVEFPEINKNEPQLCYATSLKLEKNEAVVIDYQQKDDENIEPIVYCYLEDGERVIFPNDYTKTSTTFTVTNPSNLVVLCEVR